eukprot:131588-Amphidinium_carterae.1
MGALSNVKASHSHLVLHDANWGTHHLVGACGHTSTELTPRHTMPGFVGEKGHWPWAIALLDDMAAKAVRPDPVTDRNVAHAL